MFRSKAAIAEIDKALAQIIPRLRRLEDRFEAVFQSNESAVAKLLELERRLATLEQSDFTKNRDSYENEKRILAESNPQLPEWSD